VRIINKVWYLTSANTVTLLIFASVCQPRCNWSISLCGQAHSSKPATLQLIDISVWPGPQQQTCHRNVQRPNNGTDGQKGTQQFHKPCSAYYASSVKNWWTKVSHKSLPSTKCALTCPRLGNTVAKWTKLQLNQHSVECILLPYHNESGTLLLCKQEAGFPALHWNWFSKIQYHFSQQLITGLSTSSKSTNLNPTLYSKIQLTLLWYIIYLYLKFY